MVIMLGGRFSLCEATLSDQTTSLRRMLWSCSGYYLRTLGFGKKTFSIGEKNAIPMS